MVELAQQQPNATPVYIRSDNHGWIPALQLKTFDGKATVSVPKAQDEKDILYCAKPSPKFKYHDNQVIELKDYPDKVLPMQNVDSSGMVEDYKDMADLPFLHEVRMVLDDMMAVVVVVVCFDGRKPPLTLRFANLSWFPVHRTTSNTTGGHSLQSQVSPCARKALYASRRYDCCHEPLHVAPRALQ
jgi:hypothetical protein